jgi:serine phosphatase RsbU (regulator of sigma subunit)/anti-sigma regulatory factor (Ser/Thr protein kinase)
MNRLFRKPWQGLIRRSRSTPVEEEATPGLAPAASGQMVEFEMPPGDPLMAYLLSVSSVVEVEKLHLESPTLQRLKESGAKVIVPLISQGELIGILNLGPRRSEQEYSADDRRLLNTLAAQAAPSLRVAQLARQQQAEARERERLAHEMRVARVIQQTLLPKGVPELPGWHMAAHWQPARAVSGDFYDFIPFPDGRLGIIAADVTDKGVPAALVMATTRSILRAAAERLAAPGLVLAQANNTLCPDMPPNMFVTCLYALLDPTSGNLRYANAGHTLPYQRTAGGVVELRARGMPLGLMPDMAYEEKETQIAPGDQVILYSDGLVEAHNPQGAMFGFPRLRELLLQAECDQNLIECLLEALLAFTGPEWEQEDDVTFVSLARAPQPEATIRTPAAIGTPAAVRTPGGEVLASFSFPSRPGGERHAAEAVARVAQGLGLSPIRMERLKTAVAEATMNAMEHGNQYRPDLPVTIEVARRAAPAGREDLLVSIRDFGGSAVLPAPEAPDLEAKLAGTQSPRGWGLFLIKNMVDEMHITSQEPYHIVELLLHLDTEGGGQ